MRKKMSSGTVLIGLAGAVVVLLVGWTVYRASVPSPYEAFAQCLTDKGAKMWGAWWCPHCREQKELFQGAFDKVAYIECSAPGQKTPLPVCTKAGIKGYPTWEFTDGSRLSSTQTLETLAQKTGCELPTPANSGF
ncbi:hypothetical protein HY734_02640 [Candidatus Uhrbacteria bacterium]|nr:hypothetical protein [Candidatus Uhrbacteria bacterium]